MSPGIARCPCGVGISASGEPLCWASLYYLSEVSAVVTSVKAVICYPVNTGPASGCQGILDALLSWLGTVSFTLRVWDSQWRTTRQLLWL